MRPESASPADAWFQQFKGRTLGTACQIWKKPVEDGTGVCVGGWERGFAVVVVVGQGSAMVDKGVILNESQELDFQ